jgi:hypothetical protein
LAVLDENERQMKSNFTPEDLLLYLYKETDQAQTAAIEKALQEDWTLMEKFKVLKAATIRLNEMKTTPRTEAVLKILHYAAAGQTVNHTN